MLSTDSETSPTPSADLAGQMLEHFDAGKLPFDAIADSEFPMTAADDQYPTWHPDTYPFEGIVKALFVTQLQGYTFARLHRALLAQPDRAAALGFDPDRIPHRSVLSRAWRFRLTDDLRTLLSESAEQVIAETHPLALQQAYLADSDTREPAAPDRMIGSDSGEDEETITTQQLTDVTAQLRQHVADHFATERADNARYPDTAFYDLQSYMGMTNTAAEQGTTLFADQTTREVGSPDGDTHLHMIKQFTRSDLRDYFQDVNQHLFERLAQQEVQGLTDRSVTVAIDITNWEYYGDRADAKMVLGTKSGDEHEWAYRFATLTVVGENVAFTPALVPVEKGMTRGEIVRDLVSTAQEYFRIGTVLADSEFSSVGVIHALEELGVEYLIKQPHKIREKRFIRRMTDEVEVKRGHGMYSQDKGWGRTTLVAVPADRHSESAGDEDSPEDTDETVVFITNKTLKDRLVKSTVSRYRRRWGIENSYKTIKEFLARTTSKTYVVRLFYFAFAVLLYNCWLLVDMLVRDVTGVIPYEPKVTAKRVLAAMTQYLRPVT